MTHTLALIGCGNMGSAVLAAARPCFDRLIGVDPDPAKIKALGDDVEAQPATDAVTRADVVILAVKPQKMADVIGPLKDLAADTLFVSVAAGVTSAWLEARLPGARVVRTMPNTPLLVGAGAVGIAAGQSATDADMKAARSLFGDAVTIEVDESLLDAVTALSGSGPAYFFAFVEALVNAGEAVGLTATDAGALARQTFIGAAKLLEQSGDTPAQLRQRVTSPNGTTAAALESFESSNLTEVVERAVTSARNRGRALAKG